jgi:hypothetical protein
MLEAKEPMSYGQFVYQHWLQVRDGVGPRFFVLVKMEKIFHFDSKTFMIVSKNRP